MDCINSINSPNKSYTYDDLLHDTFLKCMKDKIHSTRGIQKVIQHYGVVQYREKLNTIRVDTPDSLMLPYDVDVESKQKFVDLLEIAYMEVN